MMNAKEFWISKFPDAETDWGKTGHDDRFQVRMMEEYAEYRVKNCLIADMVRVKVTAEIERSYGKFSEMDDDRKDYFYTMLGLIDNALKQYPK